MRMAPASWLCVEDRSVPGLDHRNFLLQDFALINPMQVALDQRQDLETACLLPEGLERHKRMMPLVLELRSLPESKRLELLERAARWGRSYDTPLFCALLRCDRDLPQLRSHLQRQMLLRRPPTGRAWLRFHDPRVFRHLSWLFDEEQMAHLMGAVSAWTWYDPLGRTWHEYERPARRGFDPLLPTRTQWEALDQIEALNRCLRDLADETSRAPDDATAEQLMAALLEARQQGLEDMADRCLYAGQRLHGGVDFHLSVRVRESLQRARRGEMSYVAAYRASGPHHSSSTDRQNLNGAQP